MATFTLQVLGSAGIVETLVEFLYALVNLRDFTTFERLFFLVSGSAEMIGEVIVLGYMARRMLELDNAADAFNVAKDYVKDPIQIVCSSLWRQEEEFNDDLEEGAYLAVFFTFWPTLFWWSVLAIMVFGEGFESDGDDEIMLALSIVSACSFFCFCTWLCTSWLDNINEYPFMVCVYSVQKVFEVYILLSRRERLASGALAVLLIIFQLVELLFCTFIVGKYVLVKYFEHGRPKELANPTRARVNAPTS